MSYERIALNEKINTFIELLFNGSIIAIKENGIIYHFQMLNNSNVLSDNGISDVITTLEFIGSFANFDFC